MEKEPMTRDILTNFQIDAPIVHAVPYGEGHINVTYLATSDSGKRYILQKINEKVFPNVQHLMENIQLVTDYISKKVSNPRQVLHLIKTVDGENYYSDDSGYWRVYDFVEGSLCLQLPEFESDFYESAVGIGSFQEMLNGFPVDKLHEIIPNFHNTPDRYRIFHEVLEKDPMGRAKNAQKEISFYLAREEEMGRLLQLEKEGVIPTKVTHNDTKLNNVLLDATTRKALCVIDLDTIMPGLSAYDFGDSIRFGASTAKEDETDLNKVQLNLERYRCFAKGFISSSPSLTDKEIEVLPLGAKTMTTECGLRFLTDYLNGDKYFSIHRENHNLDRCRTQMKLVQETEDKWNEIQKIIEEVKNECFGNRW